VVPRGRGVERIFMDIGTRIKEERERRGWTQEEMASRCGYKYKSSISKIESAGDNITSKKIKLVAEVFNLPISVLMGWEEQTSRSGLMQREQQYCTTTRIPVFSCVSAGMGAYADESNIECYVDISSDLAKNGDYFGVRVKGDSMMPDIKDRDIVIARYQQTANDGDTVIAVVNGDEGFCKKFVLYGNSIGLVSNNSAYKPMIFSKKEVETVPVRIMGVVIELRRTI